MIYMLTDLSDKSSERHAVIFPLGHKFQWKLFWPADRCHEKNLAGTKMFLEIGN